MTNERKSTYHGMSKRDTSKNETMMARRVPPRVARQDKTPTSAPSPKSVPNQTLPNNHGKAPVVSDSAKNKSGGES